MKKCLITLACICLSSCYYTVPASDYYFDDGYVEPEYYSQTTYVAPSTSYFYMSEQRSYYRPEVVYINDGPHHHHYSHDHHKYYYPPHHSDKGKHRTQPPEKHEPSSLIPKSRRPNHGRNERVVELPKDKPFHGSHHDGHGGSNANHGGPHKK